jgi:hypothetical protein
MAITRSQQAKQMLQDGGMLVQPSKTGKRPGYRSARAQEVQGRTSTYSRSTGKQGPTDNRVDDKSSALQTYNQQVSRGTQLPPQLQGPIPLKRREKLLKDFTERRPKKKFPIGPLDILTGGKFGQAGMDFLASKNRPFFSRVIQGGRFQLPGELGKKYGNLDFSDLNTMTEEELEQAYDAYDRARLGGEIRAIGDLKPGFGKDQGDYSDSLFPLEGIMAQAPSDMDQEPSEDEKEDEGLRLAFRADGGRIGLQEGGGIEQRLEKLGGDVSSAEQMLQGINQRLKTAESSLGSGSMEGLGSLQQPGIIPGGIKLPEISGNEILPALDSRPSRPIGIRPDFNATIDPNFKPVEELKAVQPIDPLLTESRERIFNKVPEEFRAGFAEFAKGRPIGFGGQAISYVGLPGGGSVMFGDTGSAGTFRDYLSSIGFTPPGPQVAQLPAQRGLSGITAAGYADGGNVVGGEYDFESARQMYGLGKLVKKVTRTVKKIAKSPIGKAAIIGAGIYGLGGGFGAGGFKFGNLPGASFFGKGSFNPLLRKVGGDFAQSAFGSMISGIPGGGVTAAIAGSSLLAGLLTPEQEDEAEKLAAEKGIDIEKARRSILAARREQYMMDARARGFKAEGGPAEGKEPVAKKTMPLLDMGGQEMDLRAEGGFVPIGRMEKADDVPARLSKNEFVFTADAVRNAGEGDVDKGAEVMYNMMKNLEAGGEVSEESQGLKGARKMFQTSQRLEEVL